MYLHTSSKKMSSRISHISYYLPKQVLDNNSLEIDFPGITADENLLKIGISERRIIAHNETASDLGYKAALALFEETKIDPKEIDVLLFCAQEFDHYTPATACILQDRLGIGTNCASLDFNQGCTGFIYGLSIADGFIRNSSAKNVLLITSSAVSKMLHKKDRNSRYVFGDGAAATLIHKSDNSSGLSFNFKTDGHRGRYIKVEEGGARTPINNQSYREISDEFGNVYSPANVFMNGTAVFVLAIKSVPNYVIEQLKMRGLEINDIDYFVFHQANAFMLNTLRKKLNIPEHKFIISMDKTGNTVSATIPIAMRNCQDSGKFKTGDRIMLVAFGTGFTWASTIIEWQS